MTTSIGTYLWSSVTHIFRSGLLTHDGDDLNLVNINTFGASVLFVEWKDHNGKI